MQCINHKIKILNFHADSVRGGRRQNFGLGWISFRSEICPRSNLVRILCQNFECKANSNFSQKWQSLHRDVCKCKFLSIFLVKNMVKSIFYGSFHLSGPKFDIAVEMFCAVKFLNFLLGQKFAVVKFSNFSKKCKVWSLKGRFLDGHPPLARDTESLLFF